MTIRAELVRNISQNSVSPDNDDDALYSVL